MMEEKDCLSSKPESVVSSAPFLPNTPPCRSSPPENTRLEDLPCVKNPWGTKRSRKRSCTQQAGSQGGQSSPCGNRFSSLLLSEEVRKKAADALWSPVHATKHYSMVLIRRKLHQYKVKETERTPSASKQSQQNLIEALDGVESGSGAPRDQTQENPSQEQCIISAQQEELSSTRVHVQVKTEILEDNLVDFRGLAMLPRCHATLLEKACFCHPDLAICSGSRTLRWRKFAYETLGELLFFLHSMRMREMTDDACERLKGLWEEAQALGFDLSWLAHGVKYGLNSRSHLEQKRENILALENEKKRLDEERDTFRTQLSTLTMLLCQNEQDRAAFERQIEHAKLLVKFTEEDFIFRTYD